MSSPKRIWLPKYMSNDLAEQKSDDDVEYIRTDRVKEILDLLERYENAYHDCNPEVGMGFRKKRREI